MKLQCERIFQAMTLDTSNEFDDTSLLNERDQLTDEENDDSFFAESLAGEKMRYEQVIRELTKFEEDREPVQD